MARIRIVEEWLRCPVSLPTRWRSIMVVAETWAEQRVLMRAFSEGADHTRPTIVLHGAELAIGPAGVEPHGPWGIHVHPQVDGRAQEIAALLGSAARRLAGSRGTPPRLADEVPALERRRTDPWTPGAPRDVAGYMEPMEVARAHAGGVAAGFAPAAGAGWLPGAPPPVAFVPGPAPAQVVRPGGVPLGPSVVAAPAPTAHERATPVAVAARPAAPAAQRVSAGWVSPVAPRGAEPGGRTALGFESGAGAQSALVRLGLRPGVTAQLGRLAGRTVGPEFSLTRVERDVLDALGQVPLLSLAAMARLSGAADPEAWMLALVARLEAHGLDFVARGPAGAGGPSFRLAP